MNQYNKLPYSIIWYLTDRCNLKCDFCYLDRSKVNEFSKKDAFKVLDEIKKLKPFTLSLIGGEVLTIGYLEELIERCTKYRIRCNVATNATLITEKFVNKIRNLDIGYFQVSIDGLKNIHDSMRGNGNFEKAIRGIKILVENKISVQVAPLICKENLEDISNIIEECIRLKVSKIKFNIFYPIGNGKDKKNKYEISIDEFRKVIRTINKYKDKIEIEIPGEIQYKETALETEIQRSYGCAAGTSKLVILSNGDLVACEFFNDEVVGNVFIDDIFSIWTSTRTFERWRYPKKINDSCCNCKNIHNCKGGCRYLAYLSTNDFYGENPLCIK